MPRGKEKDTTVDDKFEGAVPVLIHGKETRKGATDCIEYIDRFLGSEEEFYPKVPIFIQITNYVFSFVNDMLKYHFYSMLLYQDELAQEKIKLMFLEDIKFISKMFKGPYMCGDEITINDIIMFPWFERMAVLEHYREFFVPNDDKEFYNWR